MKIRSRLLITALAALFPMWIGIIVITAGGRSALRSKTIQLMEEYSGGITSNLESFFADAIDAASYLAAVQSESRLGWQEGAGYIFSKFVSIKESVHRVSLLDSEGHIYDAYRSGPVGNRWQGGRRTQNNNDPNSPAVVLTDREYFRALVTDNASGEFKVMVSEPYIPRGLNDKYFITSSSVIYDKKPAGVVNVAQTTAELSKLYVELAADFANKFGTKAHMYLVSQTGQLVSELRYNAERGMYEDSLFGNTDSVTVSSLGTDIAEALGNAESSDGVIAARIYGENYFLISSSIRNTPLSVCVAVPLSNILSASRTMLIVALILCLIVAFVMLNGINLSTKTMRASIEAMDGTMQQIAAGEGDLTTRIEVMGNDEIADVGKKFNLVMDTLHDMIQNVSKSADAMGGIGNALSKNAAVISSDVTSISKDIENLNFTADEQSASVTEASTTVTEIANSIDSLTRQIEDQSSAVTESSASVSQMVANVSSISDSISKAADTVSELKGAATDGRESITNVQDLVDKLTAQSDSLLEANSVIDNIASQTNLLAMNAAIEAAHAGEAGKGFSVVAEEIRKLAEDSAAQSKTIAAGLKATIASIKNIAAATTTADSAFDAVVAKVDAIVSLTGSIELAMREQNEGSRQVLEALQDIESVTAQIRDEAVRMDTGTETILKAMSRLSSISQSVQDRSSSIAKSADEISSAVTEIVDNSGSNKDAVEVLVGITGKFRL